MVGIGIKRDLLKAVVEKRTKTEISIHDISINLISVFEAQAKASKLNVPPQIVSKGIRVILRTFHIVPFYRDDILSYAHELRKVLIDYIDCIIIATAIIEKGDLITEDRDILKLRDILKREYEVDVHSYNDIIA
ncbi:MAG: PIN domain-containing protein [Thermoprotei archaeon]|nr:PIN domain-containing protein [Thermoprotei archaeon]